ncbi:DUF6588 family protein [Flavobacterium luteum]|uniref:Uncharacterized protein n=1 Tax=Flavobacterium luteum TaxID=2026654 RepID=A0A7J5AKI3_9FLAO|nr:DUF6588 family protein [Flavobacterium luteum]KAB1158013.1 hypothetical protein F6464_02720 [Flavobacterium luteum]
MKKALFFILLISNSGYSQSFDPKVLEHIDEFFNDAVYYADQFITPANDAAVYQSSGVWVFSAKKNKRWSTTFGVHTNVFFVPNRDRTFILKDSDFTFLKIQGATSATIPTALGNGEQINIVDIYGIINPNYPIQTPKGINENLIVYPHLSAAVSLGSGTELIAKFAPKTKIKRGEYQVYGFGLKHNISQYIKALETKNINLAMTLSNSRENISFDFIDIQTNFGTLGINKINGNVSTWQFQTNVSKSYNNFEFMLGSIVNSSDFKYKFSGYKGTIDKVITFPGSSSQAFLNEKLKDIYKTKINTIFELSVAYRWNKVYFQSSIAFNKFVNSNFSIHYKVN